MTPDQFVMRASMVAAACLGVILLATPAQAQHVDCEKKINPFHPCHRWVDNSGGGLNSVGKAAPAGPSESNNPAGLTGGGQVGSPAAGSPSTGAPAAPGKNEGKAPGKHGGHKGHGKHGHSHGGKHGGKAK